MKWPYKHGYATKTKKRHPLYRRWVDMRQRCLNPTNHRYNLYGGRGITVCDRWADPKNFIADMGPSFQPGLKLERIDNNGPYSPENCTWATQSKQMNNTRSNHHLTIEGTTRTIAEWCKEFGVYRTLVTTRLRLGWPTELLFSPPQHGGFRKGKKTYPQEVVETQPLSNRADNGR